MDFYSNLTIFYQTSPRFGGKFTTQFCDCSGLKYMCVCGYRPVSYCFKVNIILLERFMKHGMGIMDKFLLQPHHFRQSQSQFWRYTDKFCCCSGLKHMYVWLQTGTIPFELQYQFTIKVHEACDGNHRWISTPTSPFSIKATFCLMRKVDYVVLWMFQPKTHVCVVVDCCYIIPKSILVYQEDS